MSSLPARRIARYAAVWCMGAMVAACGHEQVRRFPEAAADASPAPVRQPTSHRTAGEKAAVFAVRQIGVPYRYGGSTESGFDCSGLVQYAYAKVGKQIPRTTSEQWRRLAPVRGNDLRVGDLLFFRIDGRISHVGLYLGDRRFVHAPSSGREVTVTDLDSAFYRRTFVRGARPVVYSD